MILIFQFKYWNKVKITRCLVMIKRFLQKCSSIVKIIAIKMIPGRQLQYVSRDTG
jgi:hypothetical protein